MSDLELNCYVLGDEAQNVFPVKISKRENVGTLKDKIKDKNPDFGNIPARSLVLWKVRESDGSRSCHLTCSPEGISHTVNRSLKAKVNELDLIEEESLLPVEELSELFSDIPARHALHIIVRAPATGERLRASGSCRLCFAQVAIAYQPSFNQLLPRCCGTSYCQAQGRLIYQPC